MEWFHGRTISWKMHELGVDYRSYLASKEYKEKKEAAKKRAGYKCEKCGRDYSLEVHHKTYDRLGNELPEDLEVVCHWCHKKADVERRREENCPVGEFLAARTRKLPWFTELENFVNHELETGQIMEVFVRVDLERYTRKKAEETNERIENKLLYEHFEAWGFGEPYHFAKKRWVGPQTFVKEMRRLGCIEQKAGEGRNRKLYWLGFELIPEDRYYIGHDGHGHFRGPRPS